jgi:hypothetical protein
MQVIEPLFGQPPSLWTGTSLPGIGWYPVPFPMAQPGVGAGTTFGLPPSVSPLSPAINVTGSVPPLMTPEIPVPTLVAAVAVRRGRPQGPTNDHEIEDFIYDVFELVSGANEVDVRCEGGRVTLSGPVFHKRVKHDLGEIAWALPVVNDVQNNVSLTTRRRARQPRDSETPSNVSSRKPA